MRKGKALLLTVVCLATAIVSVANQQTIALLAFGAGAVLFFSIWLYKYLRDRSIITQAKRLKAQRDYTAAPAATFSGGRWLSQAQVASLSQEAYGQLLANYFQLGTNHETYNGFLVSMSDRYAGMYVLGVQGVGKSGFLENLILQDILNNLAVIVIDPHGDLIQNCIAQLPDVLPPEKLNKIYLLDMEDEEYPFGLNPFALPVPFARLSAAAQAQAIDRIMHVFEVLWPDVMSQHYLPRYLRAAIIALFANPGSTLVDMHRFLTDSPFRSKLLQAVKDLTVLQFWSSFDALSASQQRQQVEPLIGRLESIFMGRSLVRNIVGQRETSINVRQAIENKGIIFVRLPLKTLAQDARLIGMLLIACIHAAIFSFADVPEEQRPGFSLFVDEFQHFATSDFGEMFTEGRKFRVRVTVAHQYRNQLPAFLQAATMTARNKVCFQVTPEDAREMAHLYVDSEDSVRPEDIDSKPVEHLQHHGSDNFDVQMFVERYVLPLQSQKHSGSIEITHPGFRLEHIGYWVLNVEAPKDKPKVADPSPYLNHLLYQVMKTGNAQVHIPDEIVYGFANCGRGFYSAFRYFPNKGKLLSPDVRFPEHLVVEGAHGLEWTRHPEDSKEELYCFLYHLRATMSYLAAHPIGKKSTQSPADIAQRLVRLPRRQALVRSGDDVGVIYTDDTLPHMDGDTVLGKYVNIKVQTRQKYCRPKDQPVDGFSPPNKPDGEPPLSRWEEVEE